MATDSGSTTVMEGVPVLRRRGRGVERTCCVDEGCEQRASRSVSFGGFLCG